MALKIKTKLLSSIQTNIADIVLHSLIHTPFQNPFQKYNNPNGKQTKKHCPEIEQIAACTGGTQGKQ